MIVLSTILSNLLQPERHTTFTGRETKKEAERETRKMRLTEAGTETQTEMRMMTLTEEGTETQRETRKMRLTEAGTETELRQAERHKERGRRRDKEDETH